MSTSFGGFSFVRRIALAAGLLAVAACASAPAAPLSPPQAITSLQAVAGEWKGTVTGAIGASTFAANSYFGRVTIAPDGTYTSNVNGTPGQGKAEVRDGKLVYDGSGNRGTATLHERGGQQVLRGEGTLVGIGGWSSWEMTR